MGLELVEIVMDVENEFGVSIEDADAYHLTTPQHVANYLYKRVRTSQSSPCPSQMGFYLLRKALCENFSFQRNEISPKTRFDELFQENVRSQWQKLWNFMQVETIPRLQRNKALRITSDFVLPALVFVVGYFVISAGFSIALLIFLVAQFFGYFISIQFANVIPDKFNELGKVISFITCSHTKIWSKEEILEKVIEITSSVLGLSTDKIKPNSNFIDDLGAG